MGHLEGPQNREGGKCILPTIVIASIFTLNLGSKVYICRSALGRMLQPILTVGLSRPCFNFRRTHNRKYPLCFSSLFSFRETVVLSLLSIFSEHCLWAHRQNWPQNVLNQCLSLPGGDRACRDGTLFRCIW